MPEDVRYEDQLHEAARPGSGGTNPGVGGSHGAAEDGTSGYRGAAEANVEDNVSGNPDKTSYSATSGEAATTTNPTVYRDPGVDPAANLEIIEQNGGAAPDGGPRGEPMHGQTDSPGHIDPAQKQLDTEGPAPIPTVDPTVDASEAYRPTGSLRSL